MKMFKRIVNMFSHRKNVGENNNEKLSEELECEGENGNVKNIKDKSRLQRTQDSIREIFLMCMEPFM